MVLLCANEKKKPSHPTKLLVSLIMKPWTQYEYWWRFQVLKLTRLLSASTMADRSQSCSARPRWRIEEALLMRGGGGQVIMRKACPWTIVGNVCGECHDSCTLKTTFVDFEKEKVHCTSIPNSPCFFICSQKSSTRFANIFLHFYGAFIYC
jgi:hypothetical protein